MRAVLALPLFSLIIGIAPTQASASEVEMVAIPAPMVKMTGRVLQKDGISLVRNAELRLASRLDGESYKGRSDKKGRFKVKVPIGPYNLAIAHRREVFESPSIYTLPIGGPYAMDFLLLPDFESNGHANGQAHGHANGHANGRANGHANGNVVIPTRLPAPPREADQVVGSIVDMAPQD